MEKKFKNTFGVTGTETEIDHFIKEVEKMGWNFKSTTSILDCLFFNGDNGEFWYRVSKIDNHVISLSTLDGWNKALELASEKEQEEIPEYVECINNANCSHLILGKIYPLIITKNIQVFPDFYIIEDKKRPEVYHKKHFIDSTLEDFQIQEVVVNKKWANSIDMPQEEPARYTVEEFINKLKKIR